MQNPPTIVLLPGMHGTADLFPPFLEVVPPEIRCRIVVFLYDRVMNYDAMLQFIEQELSNERDMLVIGESYSGPLAVRFAAAHPDRVRGAVLSGAFVRPPLPSALRHLVFPWISKLPMPSFAIRYLVAGWGASEEWVGQIRDAIRRPLPEVLAGRARDVLTVDCTAELRACRVPILYLAATEDHMVRPSNLRKILEIRPDIQVRPIQGPHLILESAPREAWAAIRDFAETSKEHLSPTV